MSNDPLIRFGTDGWRALIARDYTFENVRICAAAVAAYLKEEGLGERGAVVGYDTRFGSPEFAAEAAAVIAASGIPAFLSDNVSPTPVVSYNILHRQAGGGVIGHAHPSAPGLRANEPDGLRVPQRPELLHARAVPGQGVEGLHA